MKTDIKNQFECEQPQWLDQAVIYEVNTRCYTKEGTFESFSKHIPRLKELGVNVLWIMPVNPIGIERKKGELGSNYAVRDYRGVNTKLGTLDELKSMIKTAHAHGMKVIFDWVANHTSWDNALIQEHPQWFKRDSEGTVLSPHAEWTDTAQLDYSIPELRGYMRESMAYWIQECGIDGYRCDVADYVPADFWEEARDYLDTIKKPLLFLAEADRVHYQKKAFNCAYGGMLFDFFIDLKNGVRHANDIDAILLKEALEYPYRSMMMRYVANHDSEEIANALEKYGDAFKPITALCFALPGIPLVYGGHEAGLNRPLSVFDKEEMWWDDMSWTPFFASLFSFRKNNCALWGDHWNSSFTRILTNAPQQVFAFIRQRDGNTVAAFFNLSDKPVECELSRIEEIGQLNHFTTGNSEILKTGTTLSFRPWEYCFYT